MLDLLKGLTDGHKYEIDTEKLKKVYNFKLIFKIKNI